MIVHALQDTSGTVLIGIANHLWQSTLFALAMALLAVAFRHHHARTRYWLWFAASMKFLLPFYLLVLFGSHLPWLHRNAPRSGTREVTGSYLLVERMSQPFALGTTELSAPATLMHPSTAGHSADFPTLAAVLALVWLCGFLSVTARWFSRSWKISAAIRSATSVSSGREIEALRRMENLGALRRSIEVRSLEISMEPGVFGLLRPILLWPQEVSGRLDDAHLDAVVAHEVSHIRRRDNLTAAMHMFVEAVFWFHPLVWWLETRLVEEREHACDEDVLRLLGQPDVYAESILQVCEFCVESTLACVSGITGADLSKRVAQIMQGDAGRRLGLGGKLVLTMTALLAAGTPVTLGWWHQPAVLAHTTSQPQATAEKEPAMAADASPVFQVAVIKPTDPNTTREGWSFESEGHHINCANATLENIMVVAYGIHIKQVVDAPEWFSKERFDIHGIPDQPGVPNLKQVQHMYQRLLADRFHLVFHRETRDLPIYAITIAKGGPILTPADPKERNNAGSSGGSGFRTLKFTNMSMPDLALNLNLYEDRPVVDQTSLPGRYNFTLKWTYDVFRETEAGAPPPLFTAIKEQLGLRMDAVKGPAEVYVIDRVERPSEN